MAGGEVREDPRIAEARDSGDDRVPRGGPTLFQRGPRSLASDQSWWAKYRRWRAAGEGRDRRITREADGARELLGLRGRPRVELGGEHRVQAIVGRLRARHVAGEVVRAHERAVALFVIGLQVEELAGDAHARVAFPRGFGSGELATPALDRRFPSRVALPFHPTGELLLVRIVEPAEQRAARTFAFQVGRDSRAQSKRGMAGDQLLSGVLLHAQQLLAQCLAGIRAVRLGPEHRGRLPA